MLDIINVILIIIFLVCWGLIVRKVIVSRCAPVKSVKAEVVDKYKADIVSKYPMAFMQERYKVIFSAQGEKLIFDVSKYSYGNYRIKKKGTLKYKGTKIISFK